MTNTYPEYIAKEVKPWLQNAVQEGFLDSYDGIRLHYCKAVNPSAKAAIVMVHGFCEFFGKYHEIAYRFYQAGYSVYFLELRGYGKSQRTQPFEDERVVVGSFDEYVGDLHTYIQKTVLPETEGLQKFLFGHSMGGAVCTLYLEQNPEIFDCAVLTSPMLKVNFGGMPDAAVSVLAVWTDLSKKGTEFAPGQGEFTGEQSFLTSSSQDYDRYLYQFNQRRADKDYQTWGSTWSWAAAAFRGAEEAVKEIGRIQVPVLICQAGKDTMVNNEGQEEAAAHNPRIAIDRFPGSRHEIFNSTEEYRERWYHDVLYFFNAWLKETL